MHDLADFLRFLLVGEGTYPVTWDDVPKHTELGEKGQLSNENVVGDRFRVGRGGDFWERKSVQSTQKPELECERVSWGRMKTWDIVRYFQGQ